jgi:transcriptional regulator with XRE-family HTH domain
MPIQETIDMHALGKRLKLARIGRDLTMQQLSALSGVGTNQISRLENGEKPGVRVDTLVALAVPLAVSLDHLVGLEEAHAAQAATPPRPRKAAAVYADAVLSLEDGYRVMAEDNRQMAEEALGAAAELLS